MPYLTDAQRAVLAPQNGDHPRDGEEVPDTDQPPFSNAACWGWALTGEYEDANNDYTAVTLYTSPQGFFVFDDEQVPTALNADFFAQTDLVFPQTVPYHETLVDRFDDALAGDQGAQQDCSLALLKMAAALNGQEVLPDDGPDDYTLVMKTSSWYGWDHWAIGVRGPGGGVITYQQKVTGTPLSYNCGVVWDEDLPLETVIRLDGLLQAQIDLLDQAP